MRQLHEIMLDAVAEERERISSRRQLIGGGAKLAVGGALAMAAVGAPALGRMRAAAQDFGDDIEVLNYALTLEHLESAFYRDGVPQFTFGADPFGNSIDDYLLLIADHEATHVETLTTVINDLGGEPVEEQTYDFGYTDAATFLATAAALENTGVSAYDGAGASIEDPGLLTAAGTIVAVEARHAAYLNLLNGEIPFPAAFETTLTMDEVLEIAGPFFVTEDDASDSEDDEDATEDATEDDEDDEDDEDATEEA